MGPATCPPIHSLGWGGNGGYAWVLGPAGGFLVFLGTVGHLGGFFWSGWALVNTATCPPIYNLGWCLGIG